MAITDWPEGERPRERLLALGAQALSSAELLAIFLRVGIRGRTAVDLARDLLARFDGSLSRLGAAPPRELAALPGLGPAKASQLAAVLELSRRALAEQMTAGDLLSSPGAVRDWLRLKLGSLPHESFAVLWLDVRNRLIAYDELFRGTLNQASVHPREVVKQALAHNAAAADWSKTMSRVCQVTGKAPMVGNNVSHANNKTKRRYLPNLQSRRFWVESENRWVRLRVSNAGLRTIDKKGIDVVLAELRERGEI